jgi:hypothetical protein
MQPHHTMLSVPVSTKPKRRTVHLSLASINKKTKCSPDQVYIRELTVSQGGLGCAIWDGSIVLARWLHLHPDAVANMVGLELGAGVGVPGIVAARFAKRVVLTDYMEEVVSNLAYNLRLNSNEPEEEEDDVTDAVEVARRNTARRNVRAAGSSALLDWHAIDPDVEDLERMRASATEAAASASSGGSTSDAASSASSTSPPAPSSDEVDSLSTRLAALPFIPSTHFTDPTNLGPRSCDFLLGAELIYTYNKHHQHCFLRVLQYYLKPGGRYYCVQSMNREGMPEFVGDLLVAKFKVRWQLATNPSGIVGNYRAEKAPKGFVQREEQYVLYIIQTPGGADECYDVAALSMEGGELLDAAEHPVPQVAMLRDGEKVLEEEKIEVTEAGQKLVQQLLPKAFANGTETSASSSTTTATP